jgi:hypothetical protein
MAALAQKRRSGGPAAAIKCSTTRSATWVRRRWAVGSRFTNLTPDPHSRYTRFDPHYVGYGSGGIVYGDRSPDFITREVGLGYSAPALLLVAELP